jgi:transposase-like protein
VFETSREDHQADNKGCDQSLSAVGKTMDSSISRSYQVLARDLGELLPFLECPVSHRVKIRTTNAIERAFREVRRRTRTMSCFTNVKSVDRIIYGVMNHLNHSWKDKPLPNFTHNT